MAIRAPDRLVRELEDSLMQALAVYEHQSAEAGRVLTIQALNTFLEAIRIDVRLRQPLISLHGVLVDEERAGSEMPLSEMADKVRAAVTLDILVGCGLTVADDASCVSRTAGAGLSAKVIINYRMNLRRRRARKEAVLMFWDMIDEAKVVWEDLLPASKAKAALRALRQSVVRPKKRQIAGVM